MRKKDYKTKYSRIYLQNKWKDKYSNNGGLIFGISEWWAGTCDYCYKFAAFGFELSIWFERIFDKT